MNSGKLVAWFYLCFTLAEANGMTCDLTLARYCTIRLPSHVSLQAEVAVCRSNEDLLAQLNFGGKKHLERGNISVALSCWLRCIRMALEELSTNSLGMVQDHHGNNKQDISHECAINAAELLENSEYDLDEDELNKSLHWQQEEARSPSTINLPLHAAIDAYKAAIIIKPTDSTARYHVGRLYLKQHRTMECLDYAKLAYSICLDKNYNRTEDAQLQMRLEDLLCQCALDAQRELIYGAQICVKLEERLRALPILYGSEEFQILQRTTNNLQQYIKYLAPKQGEGGKVKQYSPLGRIAVSFTTAHRPEAFRKTYHSFKLRCLDCKLVEHWMAIDDFSSNEDLDDMQSTAPLCTVTWLSKTKTERGHAASLNKILEAVDGFDYVIHIEDDWFFYKDDYFILKSLQIFSDDATIGQILFNEDYLTTDLQFERQSCTRGEDKTTEYGFPYVLHKFVGYWRSEEMQAAFRENEQNGFQWTFYHWPHFSLRPGIWKLAFIKQTGIFDYMDNAHLQFEIEYGVKYINNGWKTAFLPGVRSLHLGQSPALAERAGGMAAVHELFKKHYITGFYVTQTASSYSRTG